MKCMHLDIARMPIATTGTDECRYRQAAGIHRVWYMDGPNPGTGKRASSDGDPFFFHFSKKAKKISLSIEPPTLFNLRATTTIFRQINYKLWNVLKAKNNV